MQILENIFLSELSPDVIDMSITHSINDSSRLIKLYDNYLNGPDPLLTMHTLKTISNFISNTQQVDLLTKYKTVFINSVVKYIDPSQMN